MKTNLGPKGTIKMLVSGAGGALWNAALDEHSRSSLQRDRWAVS
jgi:hypothetical protein